MERHECTQESVSVSVVIPTYNRSGVLGRAIDSVLAQTHEKLELLVVDDASTDSTAKLVKDYDDPRVRHIPHQKNRGANVARNRGILASRGEYVAFLDDDDCWKPPKLEKQVEVFASSTTQLGLVYTGREVYDAEGYVNKNLPSDDGEVFDSLLRRNFIPSETPLVRRACFSESGLFDPNMKSCQDWDMWLRIAQRYLVGYVPEVLAETHRDSKNRISDDFGRKCQGTIFMIRKYWRDYLRDREAIALAAYSLYKNCARMRLDRD
jgi:glycosyltransferase involved in cell wall biosynthesis